MFEADTRYVVTLTRNGSGPLPEDVLDRHIQFLKDLENKGQLELAGPFEDRAGGMLILRVESLTAAEQIAASDPLVTSGEETCTVRAWILSNADNNHLGRG